MKIVLKIFEAGVRSQAGPHGIYGGQIGISFFFPASIILPKFHAGLFIYHRRGINF